MNNPKKLIQRGSPLISIPMKGVSNNKTNEIGKPNAPAATKSLYGTLCNSKMKMKPTKRNDAWAEIGSQ